MHIKKIKTYIEKMHSYFYEEGMYYIEKIGSHGEHSGIKKSVM